MTIMVIADNTLKAVCATLGSERGGEKGRTKDSGLAAKPTVKAWEKFRVARVESAAPSRRNEKHWISVMCCSVHFSTRFRATLQIAGTKPVENVRNKRVCASA